MSNKEKDKKELNEEKKYLDDGTEIDPYSIDKLSKIPNWIKIVFVKFWVVGAAFLFVMMGLSPEIFDILDKLVLLILITTLGVEYISNTLIIFIDKPERRALHHLSHEFKRKSFYSLFITLFYSAIMILLTHFTLDFLVRLGMPTIGDFISQSTADPITFAIIFLIYDTIYILIKVGIKKLIIKHKQIKEGEY